MTPAAKPGKALPQAPPSGPERDRQWLIARMAKARQRRRLHPRREMLLDLAVGLPIVLGAVWLSLAYLDLV
jgi:hypothetical protein